MRLIGNMEHTSLKEKTFDLSYDKKGFYFLYVREGEEFTTKDHARVVSWIQRWHDSKRAPFLVELGYGCTFAEGVLEIITTNPNRISIADAIIVHTYAHTLTIKFYMKHYLPSTPTNFFENKDDALAWLRSYL